MITNRKSFILGLIMLLSFGVIFLAIMSPIFGGGRNGLEYADDMFNSLSKGSAYFIPEEMSNADKMVGNIIDVTIQADDSAQAETWSTLFTAVGAEVEASGTAVAIKGDLGNIFKATLTDCDAMYYNQGDKVRGKYGIDEREAIYGWYTAMKKVDDQLKTQKKFAASAALSNVLKKAVEPSYNYYGIEIKKVVDYKGIVFALMLFYVIYTLWYGFAIYNLFDGCGISMTKAAKKAEA